MNEILIIDDLFPINYKPYTKNCSVANQVNLICKLTTAHLEREGHSIFRTLCGDRCVTFLANTKLYAHEQVYLITSVWRKLRACLDYELLDLGYSYKKDREYELAMKVKGSDVTVFSSLNKVTVSWG